MLFAAVLMAFGTIAASKVLHMSLLKNLLRSPLSFYDVTPLGRILNRCGKVTEGRQQETCCRH